MTELKKKIWFPAKQYGWGWGIPLCWEGWLTMSIFYILVGSAAFHWLPQHPKHFVLSCIILTLLLMAVCYLKGEEPRWRWGKDSD